MSHIPTTSVGTRATSSRYGLQSLTHRLEGQPRDNESQPQDPTNDPEAALREDTARRLAELLDRPGVDGSLIADLLGYDVEDRSAHNDSDPDYVGESRTDEATPSLAPAVREAQWCFGRPVASGATTGTVTFPGTRPFGFKRRPDTAPHRGESDSGQ